MLVSIIIPVYNVEQYIEKCMDSVLGQTYRELEIICINDGSTDNSLAVLRRYEAQDSRIRIIDKENGGVVSAREAGLRIANGEYTTFVDPDDWVEPDAVMEMVTANRAYQADVVACDAKKDKKDESVLVTNLLKEGYYSREYLSEHPEDWFFSYDYFKKPIYDSLWTKLIRTELIRRVHSLLPDELTYGEDWAAVVLCCASCNGLLVMHRTYYHYVYRKDSATTIPGGYPKQVFIAMNRLLETALDGSPEREKCLHACMQMMLLEQKYTSFAAYDTLFPFTKVKKGHRIFIYGAGTLGRSVHETACGNSDLSVVGWTDKGWQLEELKEFSLDPVESIFTADYDVIVIAILDEMLCRDIAADMIKRGIPEKKIDFVKKDVVMQAPLPAWLTGTGG